MLRSFAIVSDYHPLSRWEFYTVDGIPWIRDRLSDVCFKADLLWSDIDRRNLNAFIRGIGAEVDDWFL